MRITNTPQQSWLARVLLAAAEGLYRLGERVQGRSELSRLGLADPVQRGAVGFESLDGSVLLLPRTPDIPADVVKLKVVEYPHVVIAKLTVDDAAALGAKLMAWAALPLLARESASASVVTAERKRRRRREQRPERPERGDTPPWSPK